MIIPMLQGGYMGKLLLRYNNWLYGGTVICCDHSSHLLDTRILTEVLTKIQLGFKFEYFN